jgi:hypothetical protein
MATIINNPGRAERDIREVSDSSGTGVVIGVLLVVLLAILFLIFGLPYLRNGGATPAPAGTNATIDVNLPDVGGNNGGNTGGTPAQ